MKDIKQYVQITYEENIAIIWINVLSEKMNIISPDLIDVFDLVFEQLIADGNVKAIILTSARPDFIAGADIKSFVADKKGAFIPLLKKGHDSLFKIQYSKKPIIAAISGTCYGLGTELSLACHARIISDDPKSKMALPEVKLGLLPGAGGTQRLPRLVGISKALDMMLTGKNIFPYAAKKMGLVDEIVQKDKLIIAAKKIANEILANKFQRKINKTFFQKLLDHTSLGNYLVFRQAKKSVDKLTQGNYPAPFEIIECVKQSQLNQPENGYLFEAEKFEALMLGDVSKELIALFFASTENKKNPFPTLIQKVKTIGIVGAGFMGTGIAEVSLDAGYQVICKELKEEEIVKSKQIIWASLYAKIKKKILNKLDADKKINAYQGTLEYNDLVNADIIIEAVVEKMEVKKSIFQTLENQNNGKQILATNTSSLSITALSSALKFPENVIGMHYFSPVTKMPLLEIVTTDKTSQTAIANAYEVGLQQGKICIVVRDGPGFYVNRILGPYLNECILMLEEGIPLQSIEECFVKSGFPVGPFKLMDEVGIDIIVHATKANCDFLATRIGNKPNQLLSKMYDAGYLGKKNKKGFYQYDDKTGKSKGINSSISSMIKVLGKTEINLNDIRDRAIYLLLQEAKLCLNEGIIQNVQDGNLAAILGIGFMPFTGGPFRMIEKMGEENFSHRLAELSAKFGPRFNLLN